METNYFLSQDTRCTTVQAGRTTLVTVPKGSLLSVLGPARDEPQFIEIRWQKQTIRMFAVDFSERVLASAEGVAAASSPPLPKPRMEEPAAPESRVQAQAPVKVRRFNAAGRELT